MSYVGAKIEGSNLGCWLMFREACDDADDDDYCDYDERLGDDDAERVVSRLWLRCFEL